MPSLAVLYDPESAEWLRFSDRVEEIAIHSQEKVLPTFDALNKRPGST